MIVALIDNGSLQPPAHRNLRLLAARLSAGTGVTVHAVSWKHSDRIRPAALDGERAWSLRSFVAHHFERGERDFVFVPFFISAQGAIGSALREDLADLQRTLGGFEVSFSEGLAARGALGSIVTSRIRATIAEQELDRPAVIVVDHGGPSADSAALRDEVADQVRQRLGPAVAAVAAASLEGAPHAHNRPLFVDQLNAPGFNAGDVVIAPLFLAPGRHAGSRGDLAQIARAAEDRLTSPALRCHFTPLVGTHPLVAEALTAALRSTLSTLHARSFA